MKRTIRFVNAAKIVPITMLLGALLCSTYDANAQSVGVNFVGAGGANGTLAPGDVAGVPAVAQGFWNNAAGSFASLTNLTDSAGQQTAISAEWRAVCGVGENGSTEPDDNFTLMRGSLRACVPGNGIAFSDIPYPIYDLIVYMSGPASATGPGNLFYRSPDFDTFPPAAEGNSPPIMYLPTFDGNFVEATPTTAGNYYVFHDLTYRDVAVGSIYFPLSAVQLVAVPEPSATLLALLSVIVFAVLLRLKTRHKPFAKTLLVK